MEALLQLLVFAALLLAGLLFGRAAERRHYRDIVAREEALGVTRIISARRSNVTEARRYGPLHA